MMPNSRITQIMKTFKPAATVKTKTNLVDNWMTFGENNEYELSVANDFKTRQSAYFLLYKNYTEKEYIQPNANKLWYAIHDANQSTFTVVVKKDNKVVGAVTVNFKDTIDLPACQLFQEEINQIRSSGKNVCEITSLGIDSKAIEATEILIKLFNYAYIVSKEVKNCSGFIITVNPKHVSFYKRKLLFSKIGDVKEYTKVGGAPAVFLLLDFENVDITIREIQQKTASRDSLRTLYVSFNNSNSLINHIQKNFLSTFKPMDKREINLFFYDNIDKWNTLNSKEKAFIQQRLFNKTANSQ